MTERSTALTVGEVARRFGVTVRTLHHYDEIGLLEPSGRTSAGYRLYTEADLDRMQQVVVYRRLGFSLEDVATLLGSETDPVEHLRRQRAAITDEMTRLESLVRAIDDALEARMNDRDLTDAELRELFGPAFSDEYQAEAEQRWGETPQFRQSSRRTAEYTRADWLTIKAEQQQIFETMVARFTDGVGSDEAAAMDAVEAHRVHVDRWYYDCPREFHVNLGELFAGDSRYTDGMGAEGLDGFGDWVREAIRANARR